MKALERFETLRNWTADERFVIKQVAQLATGVFKPRAADYDERKAFPWENIQSLKDIGLNRIFIPAAYGGAPLSYRCYLEVVRIISEACASTGVIYSTNSATSRSIFQFGTEEQSQRFLPRIAAGGLAALAITEAHAGSAAGDMRTTFRPDGNDIVIDGEKIFITSGDVADIVLLFGKWSEMEPSSKAISALILERGTPGFDVMRLEKKMGMHASSTAALSFKDCRVSRCDLLGEPGDGMKILLATLNKTRPSISAQALGIATAAFNDMLAYTNERRQGGRRIVEYQANQFLMADHATNLLMARVFLDYVASLFDDGIDDIGVEASMVKTMSSDLAMRLTTDAVQMHGGCGYTREYRVERLMREAKVTQIWEGTNEIQRQLIGRDLVVR